MNPPPVDPGPHWGEVGIHGVPRLREWDVVVTVEAPELVGDALTFVSLPDGSLVLEHGDERNDLAVLADAVGGALPPPYRAEAVPREARTWAVGARSIEVVEVPEEIPGDEVMLTVHDGVRDVLVDGERSFGSLRALEHYAEQRFGSYSLVATRLDGALWEVRLAAL